VKAKFLRYLLKSRVLILGAIVSWLLLVAVDMLDLYLSLERTAYVVPTPVKGFFLNAFFLLCFFGINSILKKKSDMDSDNIYNNIWQAFAISVICAGFSMFIRIMISVVGEAYFGRHFYLYNFFYHLDFTLLVVFLTTTFLKWKRLIRYQASHSLEKYWAYFEYAIFAALILNFIQFKYDLLFNTIFFVVGGFSLVVSFNVKWIPYLDFKQKLTSIFVISVILVIQVYFLFEISNYSKIEVVIFDTVKSVFFTVMYAFTAIYSVVALLVLIFNLPTSSVFQKKLNEIARFQDLSGSLLEGKNEKQVYETLLDYAFQTAKADAGWLELDNDEGDFINKNISKSDALTLRNGIIQVGYDNEKPRKYGKQNLPEEFADFPFQTILTIPLVSNRVYLGRIVLMKQGADAFDNMTINTLNAFAIQGSLVIYNFRLISDAIQTQRYREEVKIAKKVHDRLLPDIAIQNEHFEFFVENESADDVGGDYYDYYKISENKFALIIADVSGKGTTAAFNMAQMKGVFHSLVRFDLSPDLFFEYANNALSGCLERNMFITASYFVIDTEGRNIYFSRAGHCPTLYYSERENRVMVFKGRGLGLGIMRTEQYTKFIEVEKYAFEKGDILMLYTDGISEARNPDSGEEYGQDRICAVLEANKKLSLHEISDILLADVKGFMKNSDLKDDYTVALARFL
jgi:hypothetical protein